MKLVPCSLGPSLTFEEAQNLSPNFSPVATLPEKTSEISLGHFGSLSSFRTDFLFAYYIFPRFLMRAEATVDSRHNCAARCSASYRLRYLFRVCCAHLGAHWRAE